MIAGALALAGAFAVLPREHAQPHDRAGGDGRGARPAGRARAWRARWSRPRPWRSRTRARARDLPGTGGIDGFVQDAALIALDRAACRYGSSREELALALADEDDARAFRAAHGVDPRSTDGLLDIIGISLG